MRVVAVDGGTQVFSDVRVLVRPEDGPEECGILREHDKGIDDSGDVVIVVEVGSAENNGLY